MRKSLAVSLLLHATLVAALWQLTVSRPAPGPGCALHVSPPSEPPAAERRLDAPEPPQAETPEESWPCDEAAAAEEAPAVAAPAEPPLSPRGRAISMYRLPVPLKRPGARAPQKAPPPVAATTRPKRQGPTHPPRLEAGGGTIPYPAVARRRGWTGRVLLCVFVGTTGRVTKVKVERSSGHACLDTAASGAAWTWRFRPARKSGKPVAAWFSRAVVFRLES